MKKVLIITYFFPPSNEVAIHRILRLGRWLPEYGWEPVVLTTPDRLDYRTDPDNIRLVDESFKSIYNAQSCFSKFYVKLGNDKSFISKAFFFIIQKLSFPDKYIHWFWPGVKIGLEIIKKHKIDAIWATLPPSTNGLIGAHLSKITGIPLLIDYRDPWTLCELIKRSKTRIKINKVLEKRMLKKASAICTTSKPMSKLFIDNNYSLEKATFTITNSIDKKLQTFNKENNNQPLKISGDKIVITYVGEFYYDRNPFTFIEALANLIIKNNDLLNKIIVHFVGSENYDTISAFIEKKNLSDLFQFTGKVKYEESLNIAANSDILLLINGKGDHNKIYIPGKLYDYLAVEKPIFFIGNGQPAEIIKSLNIGESTNHDVEEIKEKLLFMINNLENYSLNKKKLRPYQSKAVAKELAGILDSIQKKLFFNSE